MVSEGSHRFPRRVGLFSGVGVKMLISIEINYITYRTYDFPGEGCPDPIPPLNPHMHSFFRV